jgi:formylglycine-generating enzyme required for sulfatase activity
MKAKLPVKQRTNGMIHTGLTLLACGLLFGCSPQLIDTGGVPVPSTKTFSGVDLREVGAGSFVMGCTDGQDLCSGNESPTRNVELSVALLAGVTEVTQGQYEVLMGLNPSIYVDCGADCPVDNVSWFDAIHFANALSVQEGFATCYTIVDDLVEWLEGVSCAGYRLPTEAEWEYLARAGTDLRYAGSDTIADVGWIDENSGGSPRSVGLLAENGWGLHDMSGNVWEWAWDWYDGAAYDVGDEVDPTGPDDGQYRIFRGGSWTYFSDYARVSYRGGNPPTKAYENVGLRVVRSDL